MQPAIRGTCAIDLNVEPSAEECAESAESVPAGVRRWIDDALDWLDRYWDDPELRTGFWKSGWKLRSYAASFDEPSGHGRGRMAHRRITRGRPPRRSGGSCRCAVAVSGHDPSC